MIQKIFLVNFQKIKMTYSDVSVKKGPDSCYLFIDFRRLIHEIAREDDKAKKIDVLKSWIIKAEADKKYKVDLQLFCQLLVPRSLRRESKITNHQINRIFSELFNVDYKTLANATVEKGLDVAIKFYFLNNKKYHPADFSTLTIREVYNFLQDLTCTPRHNLRKELFHRILPVCTANDLRVMIALIKRDLQINLTAKQLAEAISPKKTKNFRSIRDFHKVLHQFGAECKSQYRNDPINHPFSPMLAEPCRSVDQALLKCPKGLYAEIKYDGERTQVHKRGHNLFFFSRNLRPTPQNKVCNLQNHVFQALQNVEEIILDGELVHVDKTGEVMTLGKMQDEGEGETTDVREMRGEYCLVIFDCMYSDGNVLIGASLKNRRRILEETIIEIKNKVKRNFLKHPPNLNPYSKRLVQSRILKPNFTSITYPNLK